MARCLLHISPVSPSCLDAIWTGGGFTDLPAYLSFPTIFHLFLGVYHLLLLLISRSLFFLGFYLVSWSRFLFSFLFSAFTVVKEEK